MSTVRIWYFANGGGDAEEIYIGSADLMHRNFDRRVEVTTPIRDPEIATYIRDTMLPAYLNDEVNAHVLDSDGTYAKVAEPYIARV